MGRSTFVFQLEDRKTFSALPRMEAVCEVGLKLEAEEEDVGVLLSLLHYTTIITFSCVFFTLGRRKWLQPGVEAAKTASVFDVLRRFCSLLLEDGLEPTFYSENFCPTRLPPILEAVWKKVDDLCVMRYRCANFLIYCMTSSFRIIHYGSLRTFIALNCL